MEARYNDGVSGGEVWRRDTMMRPVGVKCGGRYNDEAKVQW